MKDNHYSGQKIVMLNLLMRLIYIYLHTAKIFVFSLTVKNQKLGINVHKQFTLNVRKAYIVLA